MKRFFIFSFLILFCGGSLVYGQSNLDSLKQVIMSADDDTSKVWKMHDLARKYMMVSTDSMMVALEEALELSRKLKFVKGEIASLHRLSQRYQYKGNQEKQKQLNIEALQLAKEHDVKSWLGQVYNGLGNIYYYELKYDSAFLAYTEAERAFKAIGKNYMTWETNLFMYRLFSAQNDNSKAEGHIQIAYELTKERGNRMDYGWVLAERLKFYLSNDMLEKYSGASEEYLQFIQGRKGALQSNRFHSSLFQFGNMDPDEIIRQVEDIIPFHKNANNNFSLIETYAYLGDTKRKNGDYPGAIEAYQNALTYTLATESNAGPEAKLYKLIQDTHEENNNIAEAFPYLKKYHQTMDSLNSVEVQKNMDELEVKFETAKKDEELAQSELALAKSAQARVLFSVLAVAGIILALVAFWFLYFKSRTNRTLAAQKTVIEKALSEKEILLKEIHHRVKNNLQVISSLLNWQSKYIEDNKALESMQEGRNRVQSMALIHQNLYQSENLTGIAVSDYIDKLGTSLFNSYNIKQDQVKFKSEVEPMTLDVDTLIPLGLILNELLSNSLKHAFPENREGQINVSLQKQEENLLLEVKDDGVGMAEHTTEKLKGSFGHKLIEAFAQKLKAQLQIDSSHGTTVRLLIQDFKAI
ncbi:MAG: sensor histidine kinase [Bacteroidota bacterium]